MSNDAVNQFIRGATGRTAAPAPPTAVAAVSQNGQEGTPAPTQATKPDVSAHMRGMLHSGQGRGAGTVDAGTVAFMTAARKAGAKDAAALYRAHGDSVIVDLNGDVHGDVDALIAQLKREQPTAFMRFTIDGGAGLGDATGDATTRNPARGTDVARAALDIHRRYRDG